MSVNKGRSICSTHRKALNERLLHNVLAAEDNAVERIVTQSLRSGVRVNVDDEFAVQNRVCEGVVGPLPVRKVQAIDEEVALFAVDLGCEMGSS